jgi:hypothetical protein
MISCADAVAAVTAIARLQHMFRNELPVDECARTSAAIEDAIATRRRLVDLTLSGDNAVVIAARGQVALRAMRNWALIAGAVCAVVVLVAVTFSATRLLHVKFLRVIGGAASRGLFREEPLLDSAATDLSDFWKATWVIVVAQPEHIPLVGLRLTAPSVATSQSD